MSYVLRYVINIKLKLSAMYCKYITTYTVPLLHTVISSGSWLSGNIAYVHSILVRVFVLPSVKLAQTANNKFTNVILRFCLLMTATVLLKV